MNGTNIQYDGPQASIASVTGSPLWGVSVEDTIKAWVARGWEHTGNCRPMTPYGLGPLVVHFIAADGRDIIWIPSYGGEAGSDFLYDQTLKRVFWVLWKAGVKVLLVGGTSGVAEWRKGENIIRPGDIVLPTDFRTTRDHRGLPGTEFATVWPKYDLTLEDPFCTELSALIEEEARKYVAQGLIGKVHTSRDVRVALVVPDGITYETNFDIEMWQATCATISQMKPDLPPRVTLHGDCINPVLARLLGIHVAYYHMVANWAQGASDVGIVDTLYPLYLGSFTKVALEMEWNLLSSLPLPDGESCACIKSLHIAPEVFSEAMTQGG